MLEKVSLIKCREEGQLTMTGETHENTSCLNSRVNTYREEETLSGNRELKNREEITRPEMKTFVRRQIQEMQDEVYWRISLRNRRGRGFIKIS